MTNSEIKTLSGRIHSIDSLRGITLLGIFIVHAVGLFGYYDTYYECLTDGGRRLAYGFTALLSNRCAPVFCMLFGVSFYLILRKPAYSGGKFLWRCILLLLIGIFNKLFYTYDALMWYGIWGAVLLIFRYASPKILLISAIVLRFLAVFLSRYHIGDQLFPSNADVSKYVIGDLSAVFSYPLWESVKDYLRIVLNGGIFGSFAYFLLGYWFARKGFIFDLKRYSKITIVLVFVFFYFALYIGHYLSRIPVFLSFGNCFGALFMATLFLHIYHKKPAWFGFLEYYGKLGLTNYTLQSLYGVLFMALIAIPYELDMPAILVGILMFYTLQCAFSYWWLRVFTNGPLEWLWRCLTNRHFVSPLKTQIKPS